MRFYGIHLKAITAIPFCSDEYTERDQHIVQWWTVLCRSRGRGSGGHRRGRGSSPGDPAGEVSGPL